ncbi:MAG: MutS-related protein, partial [Gaiellales bacterium]
LMHQAGLHVPAAPGTSLPIFVDVFADIGDEQSVAQSLSTFSGHLRSIVRIVDAAGPGSLVLLDELGAGTDPTEGSVLAQALLDHFIRSGALVAATTHYAELKTYAHNTTGARNAAVEFDLETLSPTYRLSIGLPGTSQAFAIAERLGLAAALVEDARTRLSRAQVEFEATLASIRTARDTADAAVERAREAEVRAGEARKTAELERARARRERDESFGRAREEAERALAAVRAEISTARATLSRGSLDRADLDAVSERLDQRLAAIPAPRSKKVQAAETVAPAGGEPWRRGMHARSASGGWEGRIAALERNGSRATLEVGGMRVAVDVADLVAATGMAGGSAAGAAGAGANVAAPRT